ncbi:CPBP family intramembrane glutamic endopeptidase [Aquimarina sp. RZ0]|uniref:CPBP family intramembrane glutamic endopeptidase n=1 Tax=Aquimarina sp. RZ0 TaxID=2607730 RepID=UPI0011F112B6|nr:CPBP family intramembrane glutamic endopeptidase [Aquimarina sp. RZ0]KAA1246610.1 CPBP family intramembrane metalloprotease [Aquimarina sp. RZ0]
MTKTFLTTKLTPVIAIILCSILFLSGYFQVIIAALILLLASALEYKKNVFRSLGFQRKRIQLKNLLITAPLFGAVLFLFYFYIMVPSVTYLTGQPMDFSAFETYTGNLPATISLFVFIWISAAFCEEIVFRGYLMRQFTKFFGSSNISLVINIVLFGFIFGSIHSYQGISGQIITGILGMLFAIIFHVRKDDLWFNIAAHGFFDTVALLFIYNGWG